MRLLVVEDSRRLRESLRLGLSRLGFAVDTAATGPDALSLASCEPYDLIVLDLLLPGLSGLDVLSQLRQRAIDTGVLILSAKDTVEDRIRGLALGADDYLIKPFDFDELVARLHAIQRRRRDDGIEKIIIGDLVIEPTARRVCRRGAVLDLTAREFMLIRLLAERRGQTVSRLQIEDKLYGIERFPQSNVVAATLSHLRAKLGDPPLIHTRRGLGYILEETAP